MTNWQRTGEDFYGEIAARILNIYSVSVCEYVYTQSVEQQQNLTCVHYILQCNQKVKFFSKIQFVEFVATATDEKGKNILPTRQVNGKRSLFSLPKHNQQLSTRLRSADSLFVICNVSNHQKAMHKFYQVIKVLKAK